ncbi:MAG: porphobilinogen synthase [Acidobacteria bacterium]|nr:porphobilinogen synthase [Acidobacteriota bacterium]MBU1338547.1 porphobilinogen synthase [Acidobacteriota bacterium]MBU1474485.1 porphobilinogen synthase [Acidobacteriota bacterium]MBU4495278.1 porphobilinogen synthase [Acidobacteriota bacterium]MCG2815196.1 porphobilinogen synthase [Candidatus Aminicenantes bacterium]
MTFPNIRMRRLRENSRVRDLVRETKVDLDDLIMPMFVVEGLKKKEEISSMPGQFRFSIPELVDECMRIHDLGIKAVILFGIPAHKDEKGSGAWIEDGIIQKAMSQIKKSVPDLLLIGDVCLCEYTSHGHCGWIENGRLINDATLDLLSKTALSQVEAGADMVAPSDMMDGRVGAIRQILDENGHFHIPIMSYAAKYFSAFYGPFREAAESAPQFGDRSSYQMDPANVDEAVREVELDLAEGADIVMVKPALPYLDVVRTIKETFRVPTAAYNVSGEYSLIKAAAAKGWVDEKRIILETLTSIKRAGADMILTYFASDFATWKNKT